MIPLESAKNKININKPRAICAEWMCRRSKSVLLTETVLFLVKLKSSGRGVQPTSYCTARETTNERFTRTRHIFLII